MTDKKKSLRTYEAETVSVSLNAGLGLPPLKMVLVHTQNDPIISGETPSPLAKPLSRSKSKRSRSEEEAVIRIIEHLTKVQ